MCVYIHEAVLSCQVPRSHLGGCTEWLCWQPGAADFTLSCHCPLVSEPPPGRSGRSQLSLTPAPRIVSLVKVDRGLTAGPPCLLEMCPCTHLLHQVTQYQPEQHADYGQ